MASAVDGLKQRFMDVSKPDADGIYRHGKDKRRQRTDIAMSSLRDLWR